MTLNEMLPLLLVTGFGGLLGLIFFGGLWWTVRKCLSSTRPALWILSSFLVRMGVVLIAFYVVADEQLIPLLLCLLGFIMARLVVTWFTRTSTGRNQPNA